MVYYKYYIDTSREACILNPLPKNRLKEMDCFPWYNYALDGFLRVCVLRDHSFCISSGGVSPDLLSFLLCVEQGREATFETDLARDRFRGRFRK